MTDIHDTNERRNSYRIADLAIIDLSHVTDNINKDDSADVFFPKNTEYSLMRELFILEKEASSYLRSIKERSSDVYAYLKILNNKIELISRTISDKFASSNKNDRHIDLSQGGIGFSYEEKLLKDNFYALRIWFDESMIGLTVFVKTQDVKELENNKYRISCKFVNLSSNDDAIISRHIMQVQSKLQRLKKEKN